MPKDKQKKSNIAIWRIDTNLEVCLNKSTDEIIQMIQRVYTKRDLTPLPFNGTSYEGKNVKGFQAARYSDGLQVFLAPLLRSGLSDEDKNRLFSSVNKDIVLFIYDESDIFAVTSGTGYSIIQNYLDERFPFEIAKRMLKGDFKSAEMRGLTGLVYAQSRNFRRDYNFSRKEAFGKVWKKLTGSIDPAVLEGSAFIRDFLSDDSGKKINADVKSSFTFRKTINLKQVFSAVKELQSLLSKDLTTDQANAFIFLDTLKEVTKQETKEVLKEALVTELYSFVSSSDSQECDYDFCHPKEMTKFLYGTDYKISRDLTWEDAPSSAEVLMKIRNSDKIDKSSLENFKEAFFGLSMSFLEEDEGLMHSDDLWKYFHGEVEQGDKKYFLIDGKFYEVIGEFLKTLGTDFEDCVFGDDSILTSAIPLNKWDPAEDESDYNERQGKVDLFYFGDKVFLKKGTKGKIELFDLLYVQDGKAYIIQVKDGFGASIRDACSQIQMAAEIIEHDLQVVNNPELSRYFVEFSKLNHGLDRKQFLELLRLERHYVLASATRQEFTKEAFKKGMFKSEIAKFEVLGVAHEFKANDYKFHLARIERVSGRV